MVEAADWGKEKEPGGVCLGGIGSGFTRVVGLIAPKVRWGNVADPEASIGAALVLEMPQRVLGPRGEN